MGVSMRIMILGAPGAGKGTYTKGLSEALKTPLFSTGDLLRSMTTDPKLGSAIKSYLDKGMPVPDEIMIPIIKGRLESKEYQGDMIFDGDVIYNIDQAKALEKVMKLDLVINLVLPDSVLVKKSLGRRTCKNCGAVFNLAEINEKDIHLPALLPKKEGICDRCGGPLYIRSDDNEEVIRTRLKIYRGRIGPVLKFYRGKGILRDFKVTSDPDSMVRQLLKLVKKDSGSKS